MRRLEGWLLGGVIASMPGFALGAAGDLDCSFGTGGVVNADFGSLEGFYDTALQSDGKFVGVRSAGGALRLVRLLAGGDRDPAFGSNGTIVHAFANLTFATRIAVDSVGRIVVTGRLDLPDTEAFVARFTPTGAIDTTFGGGDGWISFDWTPATANAGTDSATAVTIDASDRPLVGGYMDELITSHPSNSEIALARLTTAGALDTTFGGGDGIVLASSPGTANDDDGRAIVVDGSGRIVVVGSTSSPGANNSAPRNAIVARFTATGVLDTTFDGDGVRVVDLSQANTDDFASDVITYGASQLAVFGSVGDDPGVARLNDDGSLDTTFDGDGIATRSFFGGQDVSEHVLAQADGKLLVTGWPVVTGNFHFASMRFTAGGALDASWGGTGVVTTSVGFNERAYSAVLQPNQRLVLLGGLNGDQNLVAARYLADGDVLGNTTVAISADTPDPSQVGEPVTVDVSVSALSGAAAPTGYVHVSDGANACVANLLSAVGTTASGSCSLTFATVGARTITAQFGGAPSFCRSSSTASHTVTRGASSIAIADHTPNPSVSGDTVTVSYSVTTSVGTPTGTVSISDGVNSCNASVAAGSCQLTLATGGDRTLVGTYGGDANFLGSVTQPGVPHSVRLRVSPSAGANGTISPSTPVLVDLNGSTSFTVTPDAGFHVQSVSGCGVTFANGSYTTAPVTSNCSVTATFNADPVAEAGTLEVLEDSGPNAGTLGASDTDPLTFSIVAPPTRGAALITNAATGAYQYTPGGNANGSDAFTFRVNDGGADSNTATVAITITPVNDAPAVGFGTLAPHPAGTTGAQSAPGHAQFDAGPSDEDAVQSALAYTITAIDDPAGVLVAGTVAIASNGTLTYTLTGVGGTANVSARVQDDGGTAHGGVDLSAPASFAIGVTPGADLEVGKTNERSFVVAGDTTVYAIVVANAGPNAAAGATLTDTLPATLVDGIWTCRQALSNTPCPTPSSGAGNLAATIDLPVGTFLRFDMMATVSGSAGGSVTNVASVVPPAGVTALDTSNDSASDQDLIVPDGVFADGFESAATALSVPGADAALHAD